MAQNALQTPKTENMSYKTGIICLNFSLLSFLLLILQPVSAQYNLAPVDEWLEKNKKVLGKEVIVLVWKDDKMVYRKETHADFTSRIQAPVGASGQWLTAAVAMALVDDKKITLEDKTSQHVPVLAKYMKGYVTLRNGLTHTTGIEGEKTGVGKLAPRLKFATLEEQMEYFASKREIVTNPQTEFFYSHVGMNIAARMMEVVSKRTFDRVAQEKIIRPLKMRGTSFYDNNMSVDPSAGARTTANDYMNFLIMLLNDGQFEGRQVLSSEAVDEMLKAQFTELPVKYTPVGTEGWKYALGAWLVEEEAGKGRVVTSPSLTGTWPYIDTQNGYAALLMTKSPTGEKSNELFTGFRVAVNTMLGVE